MFHLYLPEAAYKILILFSTALLYCAGITIAAIQFDHEPIKLVLKTVSPAWKRMRFVGFFYGAKGGISFFIPTLIILTLIGGEGSLGTIQSISMAVSALIIYVIGRRSASHHRLMIIAAGFMTYLAGSVFLNLQFNLIGASAFTIFGAIAASFQAMTILPIMYKSVDEDNQTHKGYNFARICDFEVCINLGRITSTLLFLYILNIASKPTSLRVAPFIAIFAELLLIIVIFQLNNKKSTASQISPA